MISYHFRHNVLQVMEILFKKLILRFLNCVCYGCEVQLTIVYYLFGICFKNLDHYFRRWELNVAIYQTSIDSIQTAVYGMQWYA